MPSFVAVSSSLTNEEDGVVVVVEEVICRVSFTIRLESAWGSSETTDSLVGVVARVALGAKVVMIVCDLLVVVVSITHSNLAMFEMDAVFLVSVVVVRGKLSPIRKVLPVVVEGQQSTKRLIFSTTNLY